MPDPTPTSADLAEAERRVRAASEWADTHHRRFVEIEPGDARTLLAEHDRLRSVEQAAADYVRTGLCGSYEIPGGRSLQQEALSALIAAVRTNGAFDA